MVQLQDSILERLHHHTLFNMFFDGISKAHHVRILSCFSLGVCAWFIVRMVFPTFQLSSLIFSITLRMRFKLSHPSIAHISWCVCTHPIDVVFMAMNTLELMMQFATPLPPLREMLTFTTKTITCASFNHIQLLLSMTRHYAYQIWHLHPSQCCHYWPNAIGFTSLILCNSKVCHFWCSSSQGKELLQLIPH